MSISAALNVFFGSSLVFILIFADCVKNYTGSAIVKKAFCSVIVLLFILLVFDFITSINHEFSVIKMIWPFLAALLLYFYFFIIQKETVNDSLTGLKNRYSFNEFADKLARNKTGESWAIVLIDIDNFKSINETYSHLEGDYALRVVAGIIKSCLRKNDFAARFGGDEFILAAKAKNDISDLLNNIRVKLTLFNNENSKPYNLEISYGYDVFTADGHESIEAFLIRIDELMYTHKKEHRRADEL